MKDIYTEGGYVSDEPYVSPPIIHRSECPPFTLNKSGEKTGALDPRIIDHGITKQIMDITEARKHLKKYQAELNKYQSLSRELMGYDDLIHTDKKITYFKRCIANIRKSLELN